MVARSPSGSVEVEVNVTVSATRGCAGANVKSATGEPAPATSNVCTVVAVAPSLSVTCWPTVFEPAEPNVVFAVGPSPSSWAPSPSRSHLTAAIVPSASVALEVKVTS